MNLWQFFPNRVYLCLCSEFILYYGLCPYQGGHSWACNSQIPSGALGVEGSCVSGMAGLWQGSVCRGGQHFCRFTLRECCPDLAACWHYPFGPVLQCTKLMRSKGCQRCGHLHKGFIRRDQCKKVTEYLCLALSTPVMSHSWGTPGDPFSGLLLVIFLMNFLLWCWISIVRCILNPLGFSFMFDRPRCTVLLFLACGGAFHFFKFWLFLLNSFLNSPLSQTRINQGGVFPPFFPFDPCFV